MADTTAARATVLGGDVTRANCRGDAHRSEESNTPRLHVQGVPTSLCLALLADAFAVTPEAMLDALRQMDGCAECAA